MDVFAAVSEDGGATFSEPHRVNDRPGDVSSNAEQPPRVAVSESVITIIWPSRLDGTTDIRMARSTDGGRTYSPALTLHSSSLTGARGWQSLTTGRDGSVHAVWLDGRDADPAMKHRPQRAAKDGGHAHAGDPRQDVYHAVVTSDGSFVESHVARNVCFCCKTAVGVGPERPCRCGVASHFSREHARHCDGQLHRWRPDVQSTCPRQRGQLAPVRLPG